MDIQEKKRIALEMMEAGATLGEITERLGYRSHAATSKLLSVIHTEHPTSEPTAEPAAPMHGDLTEMQRLDAMLDAIWPDCLEGKLQAINTALKIQERRAELASGGAAKPSSKTQPGEVQPVDEFTRRLAERLSDAPGQRAS